MTTHIRGTYNFSIEMSLSFTKWLPSPKALSASKMHSMLFSLSKFSRRLNFSYKKEVTEMYEAPAATFMTGTLQSANKSVQDLNYKYFHFFSGQWPRNLRAAFAGHFQWASCWTWKSRALDQATLSITKSVAGGHDWGQLVKTRT